MLIRTYNVVLVITVANICSLILKILENENESTIRKTVAKYSW